MSAPCSSALAYWRRAILLHFVQPGLQRRRPVRHNVVIPRRRRKAGSAKEVSVIVPGIPSVAVRRLSKLENLRQEHHAVQVDAHARNRSLASTAVARRPVALAEQELRRRPPIVLGQKAPDKARERLPVRVSSIERLACILAINARNPVPGASINTRSLTSSSEYWSGTISSGRAFLVRGVLRQNQSHRSQPPCREIHRGAAGSSVVEESDGRFSRDFSEIGSVEDARRRGAFFRLGGHIDGGVGEIFAVESDHRVLRVQWTDRKRAGNGAILDGLTAYLDRAFGGRVRWSIGGGMILESGFAGELFCAIAKEPATRQTVNAEIQRLQTRCSIVGHNLLGSSVGSRSIPERRSETSRQRTNALC